MESKPDWRCEIEERVFPIFQRLDMLEDLKDLNIAPDMETFHKAVVELWKEIKQQFEKLDELTDGEGTSVYEDLKQELDRTCHRLEMMNAIPHLDNVIALSGCMDES